MYEPAVAHNNRDFNTFYGLILPNVLLIRQAVESTEELGAARARIAALSQQMTCVRDSATAAEAATVRRPCPCCMLLKEFGVGQPDGVENCNGGTKKSWRQPAVIHPGNACDTGVCRRRLGCMLPCPGPTSRAPPMHDSQPTLLPKRPFSGPQVQAEAQVAAATQAAGLARLEAKKARTHNSALASQLASISAASGAATAELQARFSSPHLFLFHCLSAVSLLP